MRVRVDVRRRIEIGGTGITAHADAEAELAPPAGAGELPFATGGGYGGPLAYRQGKPMRPDVAQAFDRMARAAAADGVALVIGSAFRSDAEQAVLFARHPDPKWVARPGTSLHRNGTELDIGPAAVYPWLGGERAAVPLRAALQLGTLALRLHAQPALGPAERGGGRRRRGRRDARAGCRTSSRSVSRRRSTRAAQRWSVSAVLLSAQLYAESGFNPFAISPAGAQGIAQFMPATARGMGLQDPFDPDQAIDAQAHLMRDLLRQFGTVPLALAAYNAGPAPVSACGCVPSFPETRGYVARILGLMGGAGEGLTAAGAGGLAVRLVR